jgi:predicted SnoaL-like aldol condensation-catalyzing enzyme
MNLIAESNLDGVYVPSPVERIREQVADYQVADHEASGGVEGANWIAVDVVRMRDGLLAEHWDILQDEATADESRSGLPMFGDTFPTRP